MSSFADLERTIKGNADGIKDLMDLMGKFAGSTKKAVTSTDDLSAAQRSLGISVDKHSKLINKAGAFVNSYGQEVTRAGESTGNFNKRTSIMSATVSSFAKQGKAVSFLQGYSKYVKLGGSRLEYFAEYLTSAREELTIFGLEAGKARKFMYGFLPPGMFRLVNKFSSAFQFFGGTMRKLKSGLSDSEEQMESFKAALEVAKGAKSLKEIEKFTELIKELEDAKPPKNLFTTIVGKFQSAAKAMNKPLFKINELDDKEAKKIIKKFNFTDMIMVKGQLKKRAAKELQQVISPFKRIQKKYKKNFLLNLTPAKKQQIKDLKEAIKTAKKFEISKVSRVDLKKKQKEIGATKGVNDDKVVALAATYSDLTTEVSKAEAKVKKIQKSIDGGNVGAWSKRNKAQMELNALLGDEIKTKKELENAQTQYNNNLQKTITLADAGSVMIAENAKIVKDSEDEINSMRTKGLQGYRKRLVDLGQSYQQHNKDFQEGTSKYDKAMSKTQSIIDGIDVTKIEKEMRRLSDTSEKRAEREVAIRKKLEDFEAGKKPFKDKGQLENAKKQLKALEAAKGKEAELSALLVKKENAVKKLAGFERKSMGIKNLKAEIKLQKATIKASKQRLTATEKIITASNKKIKQSKKAKEAIEKDFKAQWALAENVPEQIKISMEMDAKLAEEDDKISSFEFDRTQAEGNQEEAIKDIDTEQENMDNSGEQLDTLESLKEEATKKLLAKFPILAKAFKLFKMLKGIIPFLGQALRMFVMGFIYISLAVLGLILIVKAFGPMIKEAWSKMSAVISPFFEIIWAGLSDIWDGASKVMSALFGGGSFSDAIDGMIQIAWGLLQTLWGIILVVAGGLLVFWGYLIIEMFKGIWKSIKEAFTDSKKMAKLIVKVVAVVVMIALLFTTAPIWLVLVIGLVIWKVGTKLLKPITMVVTAIGNYIKFFANLYVTIFNGVMSAIEKIPGVKDDSLKRLEKYEYTAYAKGGITDGGLSLVGEEGPELVTLPKGSTVHNNSKSQNMASALNKGNKSQSIVNNFNITINSKDSSSAELNRVAEQVARKIGNKVNRMTGSGSFV